ncbi:MAG: YchF family ATPase [Fervidobacterium sp.]|nr:YchF family ATPase [Fervidobacterium sp.]
MKVGIVGLSQVGKTTIFSLLTNIDVDLFSQEHHRGTAKVHDKRVDILAKMYEPKKVTYATLEFFDTPALKINDKKERTAVFNLLQNVEAMLIVVRAFRNEAVAHPEVEKPIEQLRATLDEFLFRDLDVVTSRIERLENAKRKLEPKEEVELKLLKRIQQALENEQLLSKVEISDEEKKMVGGFSLATLKPIAVVVNLDEEQFTEKKYETRSDIIQLCEKNGFAYVELCGKLEMELNSLNEEEKMELLRDLGAEETGIQRLSHALYKQFGLISFFTVGKDEVRAWTLKKGATAVDAAGVIHTDLARGFIKAEIIKYDDLIRLGSEKAVRDAGLMKLVGKEHIVEDGDIITIRFNV